MGGSAQRLSGGEGVRRVRLTPPPYVAEPNVLWRREAGLDTADPPSGLLERVTAALTQEAMCPVGSPLLIRHLPGAGGLPSLQPGAAYGFALDLSEARRTLDGGLLLFPAGDSRVIGWRAEAGALTLWPSDIMPELTELAPGSPPRMTLFGVADPV